MRKALDLASQVLRHPAVAYATIFLLQLKLVWGAWLFRDLTSGDTSSYFIWAGNWFRNGHLVITWSPLYTSFYGAMLHLWPDAYAATIAHRLIPVLALSIMVLALMRRLLPPAIAWLMAAWWVVLPIDFDSLYEVHIFAVIPVVAALLAVLYLPGAVGRGWGLGILIATTILMRNELALATLLFAAAAVAWELLHKTPRWKIAYAIPVALACALILFYYSRSIDTSISQILARKHTLNICQTYAFGYQQRNSDWQGSPWTECQQLMTRVYGVPEPSLLEALAKNPRAMLGHFLWNLRLLPDGLEFLLFNCTFGSITPDYIQAPVHPLFAAVATLSVLSIVVTGLFVLWRNRQYWWKHWLSARVWTWIAMACVTIVVLVVIVTERPRPSYLLSFGLILRAIVGMCLYALVTRFPGLSRISTAAPVAIMLLIPFVPSYYPLRYKNASRPLLDAYRRLAPFEQRLAEPGSGLVSLGWENELCSYLTASQACQGLDFRDLREELTGSVAWNNVLDRHRATLFYADPTVMSDAQGRDFVANAAFYGWRILGLQDDTSQRWAVLGRAGAGDNAPSFVPQLREITSLDGTIKLGTGWYDLETFQGLQFRWVNNDAEFAIQPHKTGTISLLLDVEGGPSLGGNPLLLKILRDGRPLQTITVHGHQTIKLELPGQPAVLRLHTDSVNAPVPNDPRILNFRVFRISTL